MFCDSLEVYGADWTPAIFEEFVKRRGYELRPRLYELLVDTSESRQLRIDVGRTLSELYEDNFLKVFQRWAAGHGVPFRIQSYGEPPATMSSYRFADLFEGEGWGWTRIPETRWASSAANIYGRSVVSAEVWTWVHSPSFRATPLDLQGEAHEHFLSGVNQLIGHGWPYSPSNGPGLGWIFYAAGALDDRNPWWPVATDLFASLHRLSWLLQQGTPVRPVKIYIPASDAYADAGGTEPNNLYRVVRRLIPESIPRTIREAGLDYDLIDDDAMSVLDPAHAGLVVVPAGTTTPPETGRWLDAVHAAGGTVITDVATLADHLPPAPISPQQDVGVVHRRLDDGDIYFLANTGPEPRTLTFDEPMERWTATSDETTLALTLHPYESAVLVKSTSPTTLGATEPSEVAGAVLGQWSVAFDNDIRPVDLPHRWEDDPALTTYSGAATYQTELYLPETTGRLFLDFGPGEPVAPDSEPYLPPNSYRALITPPVGVAAEVYLNDTRCGTLLGSTVPPRHHRRRARGRERPTHRRTQHRGQRALRRPAPTSNGRRRHRGVRPPLRPPARRARHRLPQLGSSRRTDDRPVVEENQLVRGARLGEAFVVVDDLGDDEGEELLGEDRVKTGLGGERAEPGDLSLFAGLVCRWHPCSGLEGTDLLRALEALGEQVDQRSVDVVDAAAEPGEFLGGIVCDHAPSFSGGRFGLRPGPGTGRGPARRTRATTRHPLVDAVEQPMKSRSGGSRSGAKPKHRTPSLFQDLASVPPHIRYGADRLCGSSASQARLIASTSAAVELGLQRRCPGRRLALHLVAEQLGDGVEELVLVARQEPAVDRGGGLAGDHVHLVAGVEHRRVGGVADGRAEHPANVPSFASVSACRRGRARCRARPPSGVQELRTRRREPHRPLVGADPGDRGGQAGDRVVVVDHRPVTRPAAGRQLHPGHALLGRLDQVEPQVVRGPWSRTRRPRRCASVQSATAPDGPRRATGAP